MGGPGSGRWLTHSKAVTVEDCLNLDTGLWKRDGILWSADSRAGSLYWTSEGSKEPAATIGYEVKDLDNYSPCVRLFYTIVPSNERMDYRVALCRTYPYFGGVRWWFICPLVINDQPCNHRVRKLYIPPGSRYFGCRHCHRLTYRSVQEQEARIDSLRRDLDSVYKCLANSNNLESRQLSQA